jgi:hypothetical protein
MPEQLPRLRQGVPIGLTKSGEAVYPSPEFILFWQLFCDTLEGIPAIAAGLEAQIVLVEAATVAAQTAADNANAAAESVTAEQSIAVSSPENFTPPLVSSDNVGLVTIAAHDRRYGNGDVVSVNGGSVNTGLVNPDTYRIFYDQASRAGGAVTYQFTQDETVPQTGDRHFVGSGTVPGAGSQAGNPVRPPGYVEP